MEAAVEVAEGAVGLIGAAIWVAERDDDPPAALEKIKNRHVDTQLHPSWRR
ncbi:MAG: hypothetical protein QM820_41930 [Minicystis sp.]